ncbi:carbohydrate porin [Dechloromonas sp. TW-R-39-2]|uniref:carbohydrate porin n=1 Tax=Dechloromonas sp. TW-R-39-2 TaxID=2654218 RepID=UPI00193CCE84|nr:carbohydrate porin [Dechloromonas sp. TW-R-39-2]QRM20270.1 carbohydrate porin [Dechloromonas sp. TW-R-39-2]
MRLAKISAAFVAAGLALPVLAAPSDAALEKLLARMEKLEARNADLEKEVKQLKGENEKIAQGLDSPRLSEQEPELTVRLKAVEKDALNQKKAAKIAEGLDGIKVAASLATVAQHANGLPKDIENGSSQLNYRADISVELPLKPLGDINHKLFAHLRMGQGLGLNSAFSNLGHFASAPNALAFRASGLDPDSSVTILGQAWYQAAIPLPFLGFKPYSRETLELTVGKMDIFGFFDQNAAAGDEAKQFMNSVFVHNPLLDAGGEVGVDANGFQPGFVASYLNYFNKAEPWRLSVGLFGTGDKGANYQRSLSSPLLMVQAEKQLKLFGGLTGNYRLYGWNRSQGTDYDGNLNKHTGIGASIDQRVGDGIKLFARYGKLIKGELPFNQSVTAGVEFSGSYWNRGADSIGIAGAWLESGKGYRTSTASTWLDDKQTQVAYNFTPQGAEKLTEIYYRYRLSPQFELSPDFQYVTNGGGNGDAKSVKVFALRANIAY